MARVSAPAAMSRAGLRAGPVALSPPPPAPAASTAPPRSPGPPRAGVRAAAVRIGVSGWRYAPWRGVFYPDDLRQADELAFASAQLRTIEINGSFYSLQAPSSWAAWRAAVPEGFVFAVKAPRYLTHVLKLVDVGTASANFFASGLFHLGPAWGPLLWQLPPWMPFDPERLETFLAALPRDTAAAQALARRRDARMRGRARLAIDAVRPVRHALEVRHPSFVDPAFIALLRRHGVALVVADTGGRWPELVDLTADFVYVRLHGATELYRSRYSAARLRAWADRIVAWARGGEAADGTRVAEPLPPGPPREVFCYFDNTDKVHAPANALDLQRRVDAALAD